MAKTKQKVASREIPRVTNSKRGVSKSQTKKVSRSERAGLNFPVGRVDRKLRQTIVNKRISAGASIFVAAIIEYMSTELIDLALSAATANKKHRITPRFLQLAARGDEDFAKLFTRVVIAQGGVTPSPTHQALLPKKKM